MTTPENPTPANRFEAALAAADTRTEVSKLEEYNNLLTGFARVYREVDSLLPVKPDGTPDPANADLPAAREYLEYILAYAEHDSSAQPKGLAARLKRPAPKAAKPKTGRSAPTGKQPAWKQTGSKR
jgi:hypothetical protein